MQGGARAGGVLGKMGNGGRKAGRPAGQTEMAEEGGKEASSAQTEFIPILSRFAVCTVFAALLALQPWSQ